MFDLTLSEDISDGLARLIAAGADMTPAMKEIAVYLSAETKERFETETDPDGRPWIPSERVRANGGQTLTLDSFLRGSIREDWGRDYAAAGPEASGPSAVYAAIHQFGGTIRPQSGRALKTPHGPRASVNIPARPYVGFGPDDGPEIEDILSGHIRDAWEGNTP